MSATAAGAADLAPLMPQPVSMPVIEDFAGGWYLRGDVGAGISRAKSLDVLDLRGGTDFQMVDSAFRISDSYFIGGGVGYQFNSWFRADLTAEYRTGFNFRGLGFYTQGGGTFYDVYDGHMSSTVGLANAYFDLGTWHGITPFVGAGFGFAANRITHLADLGPAAPLGGAGYGFVSKTKTDWNFAWALHAGASYSVTNNLKFELAYRYLNMGSATSGVLDCAGAGGCAGVESYRIRHLDSHDIKLGLRYHFNQPPVPMSYPVITKG